jgi:hypothetical protein
VSDGAIWRRCRRASGTSALAGLAALTGIAVALAGSPLASGSAGAQPPALPLTSAVSGPQGTWAVLAMGRLGTRNNTFWQLFHQDAGGGRWTLVTPPGVATNGGL